MVRKPIIILAESALEIVPEQIRKHPAVKSYARRRGKKESEVLLDRSYHHAAMLKLNDAHKRGRPDIVHTCLLLILSSQLSKKGFLEVYVHTFDDHVITVNPITKIPRVYDRFKGLVEKLFKEPEVRANDVILLKLEKMTLEALINKVKPSNVFLMHEKGSFVPPVKLRDIVSEEERPAFIVGCFPAGDFKKETLDLAPHAIRLYDEPLDSWMIVTRLVLSIEDVMLFSIK